MKATAILTFDLILINNVASIDQESFEMHGYAPFHLLTEFVNNKGRILCEIAEKLEIKEATPEEITIGVFTDSDDEDRWLSYKIYSNSHA